MPSRIVPASPGPAPTSFTFTVPGNERWTVKSVCATFGRAPGGVPNRGYLLNIQASGFTLASVGAPDVGTEPGTDIVTWSDAPASAASFGGQGFVAAPFAAVLLDPGYVLLGNIVNPVVGDTVDIATAWVEYVAS